MGNPVTPAPQAQPVNYADFDWDQLFTEPSPDTPAQPPQAAPAEPPTPTPQAPAQEEVFLDAGNSKYKTKEEAAKGIAQKDEAISRLRQYAIDKTGFDPLTGKQVKSIEEPKTPQEQKGYLQNGKRYVSDLVKSLSKGEAGADEYRDAQKRLIQEAAMEIIAPYLPVVQDAAKVRSIETVAQEDPDIRVFMKSDDYTKTLTAFPDIKTSIEMAENDPRFADRLAGFYRLAHTASLGLKAREASKVAAPATPPGPAAPAARPTTPTGTATPPPIVNQMSGNSPSPGNPSMDEIMRSPSLRSKYIADMRGRGIENQKF